MSCKFEDYLKNQSTEYKYKKIALTASSYKNVEHALTDKDTNCKLAVYGDVLLKLALCKILFDDKVENITVEKQKYESDKILVEVIARHYKLIDEIKFDRSNDKIPQDYDYKDDNRKYIATAVEALLAAYYLDCDKNFESVFAVVSEWKKLIDESKL